MTIKLLDWEAKNQVQAALEDYIPEEIMQKILDLIYGENMFEIITAEDLKKELFDVGIDPLI
jgi:hypothetical protein